MNRLGRETSPYLLQHKNNPVDWYAWGDEALTRAKAENKPILLSIGYSACHWCHVMEHESFENVETARLMNENFVNIKVDREERPDLDQIYQNVAQALTRGGGWPLTVFLTPDLRPFFGGTYFPPDDRYGRPGFPRVLTGISDAFRNDPASVTENAEKLTEFIQGLENLPEGDGSKPSMKALGAAADKVLGMVDPVHGGLGGAPKFPNAMIFTYLWRYGVSADHAPSRQAALLTLTRMASSGTYDQLGGGFHRYSVDDSWSVPHFEKMLYDNGLLLKLYAEVLCLDDSASTFLNSEERALYLDVLKDTVGYLVREMRSNEGGFFAAQDADSEGEEGRFFAWSPEDLDDLTMKGVLTAPEAQALTLYYGISETGNFEHGRTVLHLARSMRDVSAQLGLRDAEALQMVKQARSKLFETRRKRVAPGTDHKILASWNGLAISGLAWAAQALRVHGETAASQQALHAARDAFKCVRTRMDQGAGRLFSTLTDGKPKLNAYLDDYAFMAMGALDLARASSDPDEVALCLESSCTWIDTVLRHFSSTQGEGGYFFTSDDHEKLIQRPKTIFDQAIPSGTSVTLACLVGLAEMVDDGGRYEAEFYSQMGRIFGLTERAPQGMGELLSTALLSVRGPVAVSGTRASELCRHAHVFQKGARGPLLVCHRKTCGMPESSVDSAWRGMREKF